MKRTARRMLLTSALAFMICAAAGTGVLAHDGKSPHFNVTAAGPTMAVFVPNDGDLSVGYLYGARFSYGPKDRSEYVTVILALGENDIDFDSTVISDADSEMSSAMYYMSYNDSKTMFYGLGLAMHRIKAGTLRVTGVTPAFGVEYRTSERFVLNYTYTLGIKKKDVHLGGHVLGAAFEF